MRKALCIAAVLACLAAPQARAHDRRDDARGAAPRFGAPGTVALGAERLFGFTHAFQQGGPDVTTVSLLGPGGTELGSAPYSVPRLAVDAFLAGGLTLGIGAQYAHTSSQGSIDAVGVNPRIGWVAASDGAVALWPRAGLSYVRLSNDTQSAYFLALSLELQVAIPVAPHLAFTLSPTFDVGVAATRGDLTQLGLQAGLLGWL